MHWIYLSPHFDDAVLSCGGMIWEQVHSGETVEIWTLCAGQIPKGPAAHCFRRAKTPRLEGRFAGGQPPPRRRSRRLRLSRRSSAPLDPAGYHLPAAAQRRSTRSTTARTCGCRCTPASKRRCATPARAGCAAALPTGSPCWSARSPWATTPIARVRTAAGSSPPLILLRRYSLHPQPVTRPNEFDYRLYTRTDLSHRAGRSQDHTAHIPRWTICSKTWKACAKRSPHSGKPEQQFLLHVDL